MRALVPKLLIVPVLLLVAGVFAAGASAAPALSNVFKFTGTKLDGSNDKITAGSDGNMWFTVATVGKDVAKITPAGVVTEYALPEANGATGIAAGPEGKLWLTAVEKAISFEPKDPEGTEKVFEVPSIAANGQITAGPNGEMWVASNEKVTHFSPADPKGKNGFTAISGLTPKDIASTGTGVVIATLPKSLVTVSADGTRGPDIPLGGETMNSQGVASLGNGQIAFSKSDGTEGLGLVTPPAAPTAALMPGDPFGVTDGADGNYWFAMSAAHGLERLTPTGEATALPFVGFETWFPRQLSAGPGNTLWVLMEVPGKEEFAAAKVTGVEPPPIVVPPTTTPPPTNPPPGVKPTEKPVPNTVLGKHPKKVVKAGAGGKATVTFTFSSTVPGSTFQCRLIKAPTGKKKKKKPLPAFVGCGSTRVLKLGPGKYRFAVRAVAGGMVDASPVESAFKVVRAPHRR
jgi:virginiamycin B lyase